MLPSPSKDSANTKLKNYWACTFRDVYWQLMHKHMQFKVLMTTNKAYSQIQTKATGPRVSQVWKEDWMRWIHSLPSKKKTKSEALHLSKAHTHTKTIKKKKPRWTRLWLVSKSFNIPVHQTTTTPTFSRWRRWIRIPGSWWTTLRKPSTFISVFSSSWKNKEQITPVLYKTPLIRINANI